MAADYDRSILQEFADKLYTQAFLTMFLYAAIGGCVGGIAGNSLGRLAGRQQDMTLLCLFAGGLIGLLVGWRKAFWLKVQAQQMLCQMRIEQHLELLASRQNSEISKEGLSAYISS